MKNLISFLLAIFILLTFSTFSNAQVGTVEEAIQAARDGKEPAYIKDLMDQLSKKLHPFVRDKGIHSPGQRLAWLLAMRSIVSVAQDAARNAVCRAGQDNAWHSPQTAAWHAASDAAWRAAQGAALHAASNAAWRAGQDAGQNAAWHAVQDAGQNAAWHAVRDAFENGASREEAGRIAYRVAEWAALNYVLTNAENIVAPTYQATLNGLPPANNPFVSREAWIEFYNQHFVSLSDDAMIFLVPWLVHVLPRDWVPERHQPLFSRLSWRSLSRFWAGNVEHEWLPTELASIILLLAVQVQQILTGK